MKRLFLGLLLCFTIAVNQTAWADTTSSGATTNAQTNTSGSNTTISGGYSAETTNSYSGGQTNTTSTNNTTNAYSGDTRVANSAYAPSMSAMSQDLCQVGITGGVSTFGFGVTGGTFKRDENCERIKLSKVLNDLGMKVAAVSILCQDPRVFFAMEQSGTPCPFEGKIGVAAKDQWKKYDKLRPDFEQYVDKLKVVQKADEEHEIAMENKRQAELLKLQKEKADLQQEIITDGYNSIDEDINNSEKKD